MIVERTLHRVDVAPGATLAVEVASPDRDHHAPVVFGHSLLCDGQMFAHQVEALVRRGHSVVNIDARAHGRSTVPHDPWTLDDQARDYRRVMRHLGIRQAVVVGLSMGAMAALRLALHAPEHMAGMVLFDTSHRPEPPFKRVKYRLMNLFLTHVGPDRRLIRAVLDILFGKTFRAARPEVVARHMGRIRAMDPQGLGMAVDAITSRDDTSDRLAQIRLPSVVACGDEDTATPPAIGVELASALGTDFVRIPRAGHLSTIEAPIHTTRVITDFLDSIGWIP